MQKVLKLRGCDDRTLVIVELTDEQLTFLESLVAKFKKASHYSCQPTMEIMEPEDVEVSG